MRAAFSQLATLVTQSGGGTVLDVSCGPGWFIGGHVGEGYSIKTEGYGGHPMTTSSRRCTRRSGRG